MYSQFVLIFLILCSNCSNLILFLFRIKSNKIMLISYIFINHEMQYTRTNLLWKVYQIKLITNLKGSSSTTSTSCHGNICYEPLKQAPTFPQIKIVAVMKATKDINKTNFTGMQPMIFLVSLIYWILELEYCIWYLFSLTHYGLVVPNIVKDQIRFIIISYIEITT